LKVIPTDVLIQFDRNLDWPPLKILLYNSPELIQEDDYSFPADVYSWSFIYYELIVGKRPFFELGRFGAHAVQKEVMNGNRPKRTSEITNQQWEVLECGSEAQADIRRID
jgi:hypothetical protein